MTTNLDYYSFDKLFSYNGVFNFCCGARGLGKTFGIKKKAIKDAIKKGDQFIYLRRYKSELIAAKNTFFSDIEYLFPDYDFRTNGNIAQYSPVKDREEKKRVWITIGYFVALSTSQNQKSVSYVKVKTIIFDEFIIEKGAVHYLPSEHIVFTNFFSTVDRYRDKTKAYFLANSVSIMNPYFIAYEIMPDQVNKEFIIKEDGFIVCHFPDSESFKLGVYQTRFGKFIQNTEYADYAVANTFEDNNDAMLNSKDAKAHYLYTLECKTGSFSVWGNLFKDEYYIQAKLPKNQMILTLISERMDSNKQLVSFTDRPLAYLRTAFRQGKVTFDKPNTRNTFTEIFKR